MHELMRKFAEGCTSGLIEDFKPIPNKMFTLDELKYLYKNCCLYESNNVFIAVIPTTFD